MVPGDSDHMLRKANDCERPVAIVSRETAARAPEIPAGHGPAVRPTSRGSCRFPGRLAVRRAAWFRPESRLASPLLLLAGVPGGVERMLEAIRTDAVTELHPGVF